MLGSDRDGERLASLAAIDRSLKAASLDWHHIGDAIERGITIPASSRSEPWWQMTANDCLRHSSRLRLKPRELAFLHSMASWSEEPSEKQKKWLEAIGYSLDQMRAAA